MVGTWLGRGWGCGWGCGWGSGWGCGWGCGGRRLRKGLAAALETIIGNGTEYAAVAGHWPVVATRGETYFVGGVNNKRVIIGIYL